MKVITLWQPWASLIMIGAKPWEFRSWSYVERKVGVKPGDTIGIHAGARKVQVRELLDLVQRIGDPICSTGLVPEKARTFLDRLLDGEAEIELSALLGTVRIGEPKLSIEAMPTWKGEIADSDRLEHCKWAWPMLDVKPFEVPIKMKGWQGFFNCPVPVPV